MTKCIECASLNLRANPKMAAVGLGRCAHRPEYQGMPFDRTCELFVPAPPEAIQARAEWRKKKML